MEVAPEAIGKGGAAAEGECEPRWINEMIVATNGAAVLYALVATGVMDALPLPGRRGRSAQELVERCWALRRGTADVLERLLRSLASMGLVDCDTGALGPPLFWHTERSQELRSSSDWNTRTLALVHLSPAHVRAWWRIYDSIAIPASDHRSSEEHVEPFRLEHGRGVFEFYRDPANAEASRSFNDLMSELSAADGASCADLVAELPVFHALAAAGPASAFAAERSPAPMVVDVGGGQGHVLAAVLDRHQELRGTLFDLPHVVAEAAAAQPRLRDLVGEGRAAIAGGSFLDQVEGQRLPGEAQVFILKWILHDWSDSICADILWNVRAAIDRALKESADDGWSQRWRPRVLVVEEAAGDEDSADRAIQDDVGMWVIYGGRERTVSQYAALLSDQGFSVDRVTPLSGTRLVAIEAAFDRSRARC